MAEWEYALIQHGQGVTDEGIYAYYYRDGELFMEEGFKGLGGQALLEALSSMGTEGWELITSTQAGTGYTQLWLMREVPAGGEPGEEAEEPQSNLRRQDEGDNTRPVMAAEELITRYDAGERDFSQANLYEEDLSDANLAEADLSGAYLCAADLSGASLRQADLHGADLGGANLSEADLGEANLSEADLYEADLSGANLTGANLNAASLMRTTVTDSTQLDDKWRLVWSIVNEGEGDRYLQRADLSKADLSEADLRRADLRGADLRGTNLSDANLGGAYLDEANLYGANVTDQQLARATSLEGATMPDGTVHP